MLYPQNGDHIFTIDSVTSLHPMHSLDAVAVIYSEWWGSWGGAPSGVQWQSPWSGGQRGIAPEAEKKLNFDNTYVGNNASTLH